MKIITIGLISVAFILHAADNLTVEQKQKAMFDQFRVTTMTPEVATLLFAFENPYSDDIEQVVAVRLVLENPFLLGKKGYEIGKKYTKEAFNVVQQSDLSASLKAIIPSLVRIYTKLHVETLKIAHTKQEIKNLLINRGITITEVKDNLNHIRYAYQLQHGLNIPIAKESNLDLWYEQRVLSNFEKVKKSIAEKKPLEFDKAPVLKCLQPAPINDHEMSELTDIYVEGLKHELGWRLLELDF